MSGTVRADPSAFRCLLATLSGCEGSGNTWERATVLRYMYIILYSWKSPLYIYL